MNCDLSLDLWSQKFWKLIRVIAEQINKAVVRRCCWMKPKGPGCGSPALLAQPTPRPWTALCSSHSKTDIPRSHKSGSFTRGWGLWSNFKHVSSYMHDVKARRYFNGLVVYFVSHTQFCSAICRWKMQTLYAQLITTLLAQSKPQTACSLLLFLAERMEEIRREM